MWLFQWVYIIRESRFVDIQKGTDSGAVYLNRAPIPVVENDLFWDNIQSLGQMHNHDEGISCF